MVPVAGLSRPRGMAGMGAPGGVLEVSMVPLMKAPVCVIYFKLV